MSSAEGVHCTSKKSDLKVPYSGKFSMGANFCDFCGLTCENKTTKISSEGSGGTSTKFCTVKNFPLYGMRLPKVHILPPWTIGSSLGEQDPPK